MIQNFLGAINSNMEKDSAPEQTPEQKANKLALEQQFFVDNAAKGLPAAPKELKKASFKQILTAYETIWKGRPGYVYGEWESAISDPRAMSLGTLPNKDSSRDLLIGAMYAPIEPIGVPGMNINTVRMRIVEEVAKAQQMQMYVLLAAGVVGVVGIVMYFIFKGKDYD